ncbi:MAG: PASTA domain-containing protein [Bifidobacteriaceae bacterium]|nr:PASTA domain-containing protein [Bifidobacteriaceae bacterium]
MKKKKLAWIIGIILALIICCAINEAASTPEEMPNLVGKSVSEAKNELNSIGFKNVEVTNKITTGTVKSQNFEPGSKHKKTEKVVLEAERTKETKQKEKEKQEEKQEELNKKAEELKSEQG